MIEYFPRDHLQNEASKLNIFLFGIWLVLDRSCVIFCVRYLLIVCAGMDERVDAIMDGWTCSILSAVLLIRGVFIIGSRPMIEHFPREHLQNEASTFDQFGYLVGSE